MTEEEAKTKWCPMVRMVAHFPACDDGGREEWRVYNRTANSPHISATACIGAQCMMWRAIPGKPTGQETQRCDADGKWTADTPPPLGGYCGLAGKP